ncbi:hypothetical protein B7463_g2262, partial [Scytalidium lignicola]
METPPLEGCPSWFERACKKNIRGRNITQGDTMLSLAESWNYYQQLLLQQKDILASKADADALRYALDRFPLLRKVTITPAAHGFLNAPLYETPMIRSFPRGFNYPIPRGWPLQEPGGPPYELHPWNEEVEKSRWRGFCIIMHELAKKKDHHISELIIDANQLWTGLSCRVFDQPCEEYNNLVDLLRRPGFNHIDLTLLADGQYYPGEDWSSFRSGYLKHTLSEARELLHMSLRTQMDFNQFYRHGYSAITKFTEHFIPLNTIFPVDKWQKIQHFGLSNFLVKREDLLSLLAAFPATLRSVELSFLKFLSDRGNYRELLLDMRDTLDWRDRPANERIKVIIHIEMQVWPIRYLCVDDQVNEYIYGNAANPFGNDTGPFGGRPMAGTSVERDPFDLTIH